MSLAKARDLQSTSTLEQFMAKLCLHHQQQIVDALGFLQTEVKAVASSHSLPTPAFAVSSKAEQHDDIPNCGQGSTIASAGQKDLTGRGSSHLEQNVQDAGVLGTAGGSGCPLTLSSAYDLQRANLEDAGDVALCLPGNSEEKENNCCDNRTANVDKNGNSGSLAEANMLDTLTSSCHPAVSTLEERLCNPLSSLHSPKGDSSSVTLGSSLVRHDQGLDHLYHTEEMGTAGNTKDLLVGSCPVKETPRTRLSVSPRKARKSRKGLSPPPREFPICQMINDSDSHYDIVYISRRVAECELHPQRRMAPRKNARKSTRGHMYIDACWELKTVRTLAPKSCVNEKSNCPSQMPETSTLVTPIQVPYKPDGVPPVDIPFSGSCEEAVGQKEPIEESMEREMLEGDDATFTESDLVVETCQNGHVQNNDKVCPPEALSPPVIQQSGNEQAESQTDIETLSVPISTITPVHKSDSEVNLSDVEERGDTGPVQPQNDLPHTTVVTLNGSESDGMLDKDGPNDSAEPELSLPGVQPQDPPLLENLSENTESVEPVQESEDNVKKSKTDNLEMQETESANEATDSVFQPSNDERLQETMDIEPLIEVTDEPVIKELDSAIGVHLENFDKLHMSNDVTKSVTGRSGVKKRSNGDMDTSDRCLRSRKKSSGLESKLSSTPKEMPHLLEVNVAETSVDNSTIIPFNTNEKEEASSQPTSTSSGVQPNSGGLSNNEPEGKPDEGPAEVSVCTRQKCRSMMKKSPENNAEIQVSTGISSSSAGPNTKKDAPQTVKNQHGKRVSMPQGDVPGNAMESGTQNSSTPTGITVETSGKMQLRRDSRCNASTKSMSLKSRGKHNNLRGQQTAQRDDKKGKDVRFKTTAEKDLPSQKDSDQLGLQKTAVGSSTHKFLDILKMEENQQLIADLNTKYEKMQKGWIQIDKAGQQAPAKPKNRADRLKEIWKSKRRVRKSKALDQPRSSPVHMLFMKTFDLTSICRWFLQTTETKSLVIVKKVNTRLPSETQLCFHSSSGVMGSSHGIFPSLQAERLKKHLKKFAIASPVKCNPKNRKLISKVLEQGGCCNKGKEKRELSAAARVSAKAVSKSQQRQAVERRNPASARILRKYSSIREKLQVQQRTLKCKETPAEHLKKKTLISQKPAPRSKSTLEEKRKNMPSGKNHGANTVKTKSSPSSKKPLGKSIAKGTGAKCKRTTTVLTRKNTMPKRLLVTPAIMKPGNAVGLPCLPSHSRVKSKAVVPKVENEATVVPDPFKIDQSQSREAKVQTNKLLRSTVREGVASQHEVDPKPSVSHDQVVTRSQRKTEATPAVSMLSKTAMKRTQDLLPALAKRARASQSN